MPDVLKGDTRCSPFLPNGGVFSRNHDYVHSTVNRAATRPLELIVWRFCNSNVKMEPLLGQCERTIPDPVRFGAEFGPKRVKTLLELAVHFQDVGLGIQSRRPSVVRDRIGANDREATILLWSRISCCGCYHRIVPI